MPIVTVTELKPGDLVQMAAGELRWVRCVSVRPSTHTGTACMLVTTARLDNPLHEDDHYVRREHTVMVKQ